MEKQSNIVRTGLAYGRVSSDEAAISGLSLSVQEEQIREYCDQNGIKLLGYYEDPGISAGLPIRRRPALVECLKRIEEEKPDLLLISRLDRLWRRVEDYYEVKKILDKAGTDFYCINEDYNTTTANGRLMLNLKLSIAENERDMTSERLKTVFRARMKRGIAPGGKKTFGYDYKRDEHGDIRMVINEKEAEIIRATFDEYIRTGSIEHCVEWMYLNYGISKGHKSVKQFFFQNEHYIGRRVMWKQGSSRKDPKDIIEVIENFCEPILDMETWEKAQNLLKRNSRENTTRNEYIFSGLLKCANCGRSLVGSPSQNTRGNYVYKQLTYRCNTPRSMKADIRQQCQIKKHILEKDVEAYVKENFVKQLNDHVVSVKKDDTDYTAINKQIDIKINKNRKKLARLNELYMEDMFDRNEYETKRKEIENEYKKLTSEKQGAKPAELKDTAQVEAGLRTFEEYYDTLTGKQKNLFYKQFIKHIIVDLDQKTLDIHFL